MRMHVCAGFRKRHKWNKRHKWAKTNNIPMCQRRVFFGRRFPAVRLMARSANTDRELDIVLAILDLVADAAPGITTETQRDIEQAVRTRYGGVRTRIAKRKKHPAPEQHNKALQGDVNDNAADGPQDSEGAAVTTQAAPIAPPQHPPVTGPSVAHASTSNSNRVISLAGGLPKGKHSATVSGKHTP